eukprot:CAMPEP_0198121080 /NCGR_PEP_ID=MMETSP1442-20131203/31137_1 /TAXON_ID= /ORGANISM="Craspedostauros australis, Strain CCMP3328" /LENGTH=102 /DNA_ID=CAMNT_0043779837 /DNA_START=222 /DNA_END=527 /DNA_ORIENTATION=-
MLRGGDGRFDPHLQDGQQRLEQGWLRRLPWLQLIASAGSHDDETGSSVLVPFRLRQLQQAVGYLLRVVVFGGGRKEDLAFMQDLEASGNIHVQRIRHPLLRC